MRASGCSDDTSDGYCGRRNTEYPALSNALSLGDDARLEDFMYIIITRVPGDNYRKKGLVSVAVSRIMCVTTVGC